MTIGPKIETHNGHRLAIYGDIHMTCTVDGHNKYWKALVGMDMDPLSPRDLANLYVVAVQWGRIGNQCVPKFSRFATLAAATQYYRGRVRDKTVKKYVALPTDTQSLILPVSSRKTSPRVKSVPYVAGAFEWDLS